MADMREETVNIGCRLPAGLILEVGYQVDEKDAAGKTVSNVRRFPNYRRAALKGTAQNLIAGDNIILPARVRPQPFINKGFPKAVWEQWKKDHANHPYLED